ncbi:lipopolysaccharide assembly protein LapA domain-containing protein [Bacterioplanoides sp. SCSIO 12839]|uniref:lipopolysaccharide assembly protein LapA domain-containing protein n=1 Tax=Bacterioplanoides sp. SCSIO 12839 TaxID=2829569 RepID=UPI00210224AC|nr:LapA family protein [Bacterioplanoides sp. SCSIO 12839]UTW49481.1 LapA family protein [Bacterioplanoides sp. SCSIO 12839]
MKQLKLMFIILICLMLLGYAIAFAAYNNQQVTINFLVGAQVTISIALWSGLVFSVGVLFVWLLGSFSNAAQRLKMRKLQKELEEVKRRLERVS